MSIGSEAVPAMDLEVDPMRVVEFGSATGALTFSARANMLPTSFRRSNGAPESPGDDDSAEVREDGPCQTSRPRIHARFPSSASLHPRGFRPPGARRVGGMGP